MPANTIQPYDDGCEAYAAGWERVAFEAARAAVLADVPAKPGLVFDIGAGSGRDAAWFAGTGWSVVAVEPADRVRRHAQVLHQPREKTAGVQGDERHPLAVLSATASEASRLAAAAERDPEKWGG